MCTSSLKRLAREDESALILLLKETVTYLLVVVGVEILKRGEHTKVHLFAVELL